MINNESNISGELSKYERSRDLPPMSEMKVSYESLLMINGKNTRIENSEIIDLKMKQKEKCLIMNKLLFQRM